MRRYLYILWSCLISYSLPVFARNYDLSLKKDCTLIGDVVVQSGSSIYLTAKPKANTPKECEIRPKTDRANVVLGVEVVEIRDPKCLLKISIRGRKYDQRANCGNLKSANTKESYLTIRILRTNTDQFNNYELNIKISAFKDFTGSVIGGTETTEAPDSNGLPPAVIVGIVAGILVVFAIIAVICLCCHKRRIKQKRDDAKSSMLKHRDSDRNEGVSNSLVNNGTPVISNVGLQPKAHLYNDDPYVSKDPDNNLTRQNGPGLAKLDYTNEIMQRRDFNERSVDEPLKTIREPLLNDRLLQKSKISDPRFNLDNRFEKGNDTSFDSATPPPLPVVPKSPTKTRKNNLASINRTPRPTSYPEELQQLEIPYDEQGDVNIRVIPDSPHERGSIGEVIPIRLNSMSGQSFQDEYPVEVEIEENIPSELSFDSDRPGEKPRHTLRPNRTRPKKSVNGDSQEPSTSNSRGKPTRDTANSNDRYGFSGRREQDTNQSGRSLDERSAKSRTKSTDVRESGRQQREKGHKGDRDSFGRRRGRSLGRELDEYPSRPDTPTSIYSNAPLKRSGSRQSLYASRSSLYNRRRRGSFSETMDSYAQDDTSLYRRGSNRDSRRYDDRPSHFSRNRSNRSSRSMGDVREPRGQRRPYYEEYNENPFRRNRSNRSSRSMGDVRDTGTQTLYETATQTGGGNLNKQSARRHSGRKKSQTQNAKMKPREKTEVVNSSVGTNDRVLDRSFDSEPKSGYDYEKQKLNNDIFSEMKDAISKKQSDKKTRDVNYPPSYEDSQYGNSAPNTVQVSDPKSFQPYRNDSRSANPERIYMNVQPIASQSNQPQPVTDKSPWTVLCELTDPGENTQAKRSTSPGSAYSASRGQQRQTPGYTQQHKNTQSHSEGGYRAGADRNGLNPNQQQRNTPYNPPHGDNSKKSSWDTLQEMCDPTRQHPYGKFYDHAESNV